EPGENLPPAGRSLFDFVVSGPGGPGTVPFPFPALVRLIEKRLGGGAAGASVKQVLIPLNRSLQRNAPRPEFFRFPRVVLAVDAEGTAPPGEAALFLRDRLFVGYQEKAGVIEVISYNEAAGRFEFQIVRDYRPGGSPRVVHANRAVCVVCHQNQAPIFARQLWDETNANPQIRAMLAAQGRSFYGVPLDQGVDIPYAIDNATDRANALAAYQRVWRDGCEGGGAAAATDCRANLLVLALQYRLGGSRQVHTRSPRFEAVRVQLAARWRERWPRGLALPDPDIPNRDPLAPLEDRLGAVPVSASTREARLAELVSRSDVHARFEPANPRPPLDTWTVSAETAEALERTIAGLGGFLAAADVRRLDDLLAARAARARLGSSRHAAMCELGLAPREGARHRLAFRCGAAGGGAGPVALDGVVYLEPGRVVGGSIDRVALGEGDEIRDLEVAPGRARMAAGEIAVDLRVVQRESRLRARRGDGSVLERITLRARQRPRARPDGAEQLFPGEATLLTVDDFAAASAAVTRLAARTAAGAADALGPAPFRRARVMAALERELGVGRGIEWCCLDTAGLPAPSLESEAERSPPPPAPGAETVGDPALALFDRYCARCHGTRDPFPPNFLAGPPARVRANLDQCAERIFVRLGMWELGPEARRKAPMPPVHAIRGFDIPLGDWPGHPDLRALRDYAGGVLRAERGREPRVEELMVKNYEHLRACLPAGKAVSGIAPRRERP
ncbi:MAG: hypothetical protein L0027_07520, partial [Candidatus Rokubacteria bacterium]|nr:hypothetical protein [Candidatus Rokubacteria bacterium]